MVGQKHLLYTLSKSYISTIEHKKNELIYSIYFNYIIIFAIILPYFLESSNPGQSKRKSSSNEFFQ